MTGGTGCIALIGLWMLHNNIGAVKAIMPIHEMPQDLSSDREETVPVTKLNFKDRSWFAEEPSMDLPQNVSSEVKAALIPHAGIQYSGGVIKQTLAQVDWGEYDSMIILATSHWTGSSWQLPSEVKAINIPHQDGTIDIVHISDLPFKEDIKSFEEEHSYQIALPFIAQINIHRKSLQKRPIKVIPLLIGKEASSEEVEKIKTYLQRHPRTFILVNTDLLHYDNVRDNFAEMQRFDTATIQNIKEAITSNKALLSERVLPKRDTQPTMCGFYAVQLFAKLAYDLGLQPLQEVRSNSLTAENAKAGKYVGYLGMTLISPKVSTQQHDSNRIIQALPARVLEENKEKLGKRMSNDNIEEIATKYRHLYNRPISGLFVTIYKDEKALRGCIGTFNAYKKDDTDIGFWTARQALQTALNDHRFDPVEKQELPSLSFETTILDPSFSIYKKGDSMSPFIAFREHYQEVHGITITFKDGSSATYLPSVLQERKGDLEDLFDSVLEELKQKAGASNGEVAEIALYPGISVT